MKKTSILRLSLSLFGKMVFGTLLCLILMLSVSVFLSSSAGMLIGQILCLLIYGSFIYSPLWIQGDKDNNAVTFGHRQEDKLTGLKVGLLASIPNFLLSVFMILIVTKIIPNYMYIYRILSAHFMGFISFLFPVKLAVSDYSMINVIIAALLPAIIPLIAYVSYLLGYKRISLSEKLLYQKKDKDKDKYEYNPYKKNKK